MSISLAKEAVKYYTVVTGNIWSTFFDRVDEAVSGNLEEQSGDLWLIHALANTLVSHGMSVNSLKINKDAVKAEFDNDSRKQNGEFFTPEVWCSEARKYFDKHIPDWGSYNVWDMSCYSMDTEIFTQRGWISYDALLDTDKVYTLDLVSLRGVWSGHHDRFKKPYKGKMVHMSTDLVDQLVTPDHRVLLDAGFMHAESVTGGRVFIGAVMEGEESGYVDNEVASSLAVSLLTNGHTDNVDADCLFDKMVSGTAIDTGAIDVALGKAVLSEMLGRLNSRGLELLQWEKRVLDVFAMVFGGTVYVWDDEKCVLVDTLELGVCTSAVSLVEEKDIYNESYEGYVWDLTTDNDNHNFLVRRNGLAFFSGNCGTGNLMRTAGHQPDKVFLSTLQQDDVTTVAGTPEYAGANVFQLDFLGSFNHDVEMGIAEFTDRLPERLRGILENDEPLIIYANPPYRTGMAKATEVGRHMINDVIVSEETHKATGESTMAKPAYDIFYQFCWQVMDLVEQYKLKNCYYAFFGPLTFFTGSSANILLKEFEHRFEFVDGMCISAQEFSDTSDSILWGIGFTLWKSRGGAEFKEGVSYHNDILLEKKFLLPDGGVSCSGRILYEPPREKLSSWVEPKDVCFYQDMPVMTSHLTFKGSEAFEKVAHNRKKLADNALGTLMTGNTLTRSADQSAILSMPTTLQYVDITEENFWRCVASYTFRRVYDASWAVAKKEISAPNPNIEGYDLWLRNALVMFLFEYKSMMSSLRGVSYADGSEKDIIIRNKLFYLSEEDVRGACHDSVILADLEKNPPLNQFMLRMIKESEPYWVDEVKELYTWCRDYTLASYDFRSKVNYRGSLDCWDAGFQQLRSSLWNEEELSDELTRVLVQARNWFRKDIDKFGFVTEVI